MKPTPTDERGTIRGWLEPAEDRHGLEQILRTAPSAILDGALSLRVHEDLYEMPSSSSRDAQLTNLLQGLYQGTIKRYVVYAETQAGPRIIKLTETRNFGHRLGGLLSFSSGRQEHHNQRRVESLGIAAARSLGYLELCRGPWLIRSAQIQSLTDSGRPLLDDFIRHQYPAFGYEAFAALGEALAKTHAQQFFHADLKGFHAQIKTETLAPTNPSRYTLLWLDLGRVHFRLTRRRRIINLYQMLRFVIPPEGQARDAFMRSYCEETGWYRDSPNRAMKIVGEFLEKKLRVSPGQMS